MSVQDSADSGVSRRSVITSGVLASGTIVLGVPSVSRTALADPGRGNGVGSSGFLGDGGLSKAQSWHGGGAAFVVIAALDGSFDDPLLGAHDYDLHQAPGCTEGRPKDYQGYRIRMENGDPGDAADNAILYLNANRRVNTDVPAWLEDVVDGCEGDVHIDGSLHGTYPTNKVSFGSA